MIILDTDGQPINQLAPTNEPTVSPLAQAYVAWLYENDEQFKTILDDLIAGVMEAVAVLEDE